MAVGLEAALALLWQADGGQRDLDLEGMTRWAQLTVNISLTLLGAVLGAAGANTFHARRARFAQQALSAEERQAVAKHLAGTGAQQEALLLSGPPPTLPREHSALLSMLGAEERAAVAARLNVAGLSMPGAAEGPWLEPPAREALSSHAEIEQLRASAHARRARQLGISVEELARRDAAEASTYADALLARPPTQAEAKPASPDQVAAVAPTQDTAELAALWRAAALAFEAWVKTPPEGWLAALAQLGGPPAALDALAAALRRAGIEPEKGPLPADTPRGLRELAAGLLSARRVIADTQSGLAPDQPARSRSLQIASTAEYALTELRESAALVERLALEEKLARL